MTLRVLLTTVKILAFTSVYAVASLIGLAILRSNYFWFAQIQPLNNGTYLGKAYDEYMDGYVYNLYSMDDDRILAWNIVDVCFSERAIEIKLNWQNGRPEDVDYDVPSFYSLIYVDGQKLSPKTERELEQISSHVGLDSDALSCRNGFCGARLTPEFLLDARDRVFLRMECGPLPDWLESGFQERPWR